MSATYVLRHRACTHQRPSFISHTDVRTAANGSGGRQIAVAWSTYVCSLFVILSNTVVVIISHLRS